MFSLLLYLSIRRVLSEWLAILMKGNMDRLLLMWSQPYLTRNIVCKQIWAYPIYIIAHKLGYSLLLFGLLTGFIRKRSTAGDQYIFHPNPFLSKLSWYFIGRCKYISPDNIKPCEIESFPIISNSNLFRTYHYTQIDIHSCL